MKTSLLACVAAVALLAGCATSPEVKLYDGPDRGDRELATVLVPYQFEISSINGTGIPWRSGLRSAESQAYKLLPGRYTFLFRYTSPYEFGEDRGGISTLPMMRVAEFSAGRTYAFKSKVSGLDAASAEVKVWVEDTSSDKRIDEEVPESAPKPGPTRPMSPEPVTPEPVLEPEPAPAPEPVAEEPAAPAETAASEPATAAAPGEAAQAPADAALAPDTDPVGQLKKSWDTATPEERAEFLKHITK